MKTTIALLSLVISANVFAYSVADSSVLTSAAPMLSSATSSGSGTQKLAALILNDAQELIQYGKMSSFLNQKIKEIQATHTDASQSEALDLLINQAEAALN